uniref:Basic tail secreted protein n=1 Tax=Rhipicephalus zambeziensis TaxID=60191 RepID=A0A224YC31_9ACAR
MKKVARYIALAFLGIIDRCGSQELYLGQKRCKDVLYGDGNNPGILGKCLNGACEFPKDHSHNGTVHKCHGMYKGKGFAPSCTFKCNSSKGLKAYDYNFGPPCVSINMKEKPTVRAGICKHGECVTHGDLDLSSPAVLHTREFRHCPKKDHAGTSLLNSCYHYCERNGVWYFGYYQSGDRNKYAGCQGRSRMVLLR